MPAVTHILCFSRNPVLLETRVAVLATRYSVVSIDSLEEMAHLPSRTPFALILLCHTLSDEECHSAADIAHHRWPESKILALTSSGSCGAHREADRNVPGLDGPVALLHAIHDLTAPARFPGNLASI